MCCFDTNDTDADDTMISVLVFDVIEAEGYLFSAQYNPGIIIYTLVPPQDTRVDKIAFGFMTDRDGSNGTILRVDSGIYDYIEFKLVSARAAFDNISSSSSGSSSLMPNTHRRRRRDETVLSRRVGVGGVYWA